MTRTRRRRGVLLAVPLLAAAAACSPPLHVGTAATVGSVRISEQALREQVQAAQADPTAAASAPNSAALTRQVLTRLITDRLVDDLAARLRVSATPQQVDAETATLIHQAGGAQALQAQAANAGVAPSQLPSLIRDLVLEDEEVAVLAARVPGAAGNATEEQSLLTEALTQVAGLEHVDVSPRFGTFSQGAVVATAVGALASPVATNGS